MLTDSEKSMWKDAEPPERRRLKDHEIDEKYEFKTPSAVVAVISNATLAAGQRIAIVGPQLYRESSIVSIQDNGEALDSVAVGREKELGLKFDWLPPKNCELFDLNISP